MRVDKLYDLGASAPTDMFLTVCWRTLAEQWMHFSPLGLGNTNTVFFAAHSQVILSLGAPIVHISQLLLFFYLLTEIEEFLHTLLQKLSGVVISMAALVLLSATVDFCCLASLDFIGSHFVSACG